MNVGQGGARALVWEKSEGKQNCLGGGCLALKDT